MKLGDTVTVRDHRGTFTGRVIYCRVTVEIQTHEANPGLVPWAKGTKVDVSEENIVEKSGLNEAPMSNIDRVGQGSLTYDELVIACRNIGYDLTCGQCASVFYTGNGTYPHTCLA